MTCQYGQNRNRKKVKYDNIQRQHYDKPIWPEQKQKKSKILQNTTTTLCLIHGKEGGPGRLNELGGWITQQIIQAYHQYGVGSRPVLKTRLVAASDKVFQLLAHGLRISPGIPASSTTKAGRHDIAEIFMKVALNTIIHSINNSLQALLLKL